MSCPAVTPNSPWNTYPFSWALDVLKKKKGTGNNERFTVTGFYFFVGCCKNGIKMGCPKYSQIGIWPDLDQAILTIRQRQMVWSLLKHVKESPNGLFFFHPEAGAHHIGRRGHPAWFAWCWTGRCRPFKPFGFCIDGCALPRYHSSQYLPNPVHRWPGQDWPFGYRGCHPDLRANIKPYIIISIGIGMPEHDKNLVNRQCIRCRKDPWLQNRFSTYIPGCRCYFHIHRWVLQDDQRRAHQTAQIW